MDAYALASQHFYENEDCSILAFKGISIARNHLPIVQVRYELSTGCYYSEANLVDMADEILSNGIKQAQREAERPWIVLEMLIDVSRRPTKYSVFHILRWKDAGTEEEMAAKEEELKGYLRQFSSVIRRRGSQPSSNKPEDRYNLDPNPCYVSIHSSVKLFKGVSHAISDYPIIAKRHEFFVVQPEISTMLVAAINTALVQAQLEHPHICKILDIHFVMNISAMNYYLYHILEALKSDVGKEIKQRGNRYMEEEDLWEFLRQTSSILAYAHAKVVLT